MNDQKPHKGENHHNEKNTNVKRHQDTTHQKEGTKDRTITTSKELE